MKLDGTRHAAESGGIAGLLHLCEGGIAPSRWECAAGIGEPPSLSVFELPLRLHTVCILSHCAPALHTPIARSVLQMECRAWASRTAAAAGTRDVDGPLAGLAFAAKDSYDVRDAQQAPCLLAGLLPWLTVACSLNSCWFCALALPQVAGFKSTAGNPSWERDHPVAKTTAPAIQARHLPLHRSVHLARPMASPCACCILQYHAPRAHSAPLVLPPLTAAPGCRTRSPPDLAVQVLLAAGANLAGKAAMSELAYDFTGQNCHYGAPLNPAAPGHMTGGSSSGCAVRCFPAPVTLPHRRLTHTAVVCSCEGLWGQLCVHCTCSSMLLTSTTAFGLLTCHHGPACAGAGGCWRGRLLTRWRHCRIGACASLLLRRLLLPPQPWPHQVSALQPAWAVHLLLIVLHGLEVQRYGALGKECSPGLALLICSVDGSVPLAPSFDTAGWFARDAELLADVGRALLAGSAAAAADEFCSSWSLLVPEVRRPCLACLK